MSELRLSEVHDEDVLTPKQVDIIKGVHKLMTTEEVAKCLGSTTRAVRNFEIPFARIGRLRRYDPRDVKEYIRKLKECPSSKDPAPRIGIRSSKSAGLGFAEALKQNPIVKRSR